MTEPDKPSERERIASRLAELMEADIPERVAERKRTSARCGHIKRKLKQGERLKGELLEFAVETVVGNPALVEKLRNGQQLSDYDLHLMFDMYLRHMPKYRAALAAQVFRDEKTGRSGIDLGFSFGTWTIVGSCQCSIARWLTRCTPFRYLPMSTS